MTGVQTCALPISIGLPPPFHRTEPSTSGLIMKIRPIKVISTQSGQPAWDMRPVHGQDLGKIIKIMEGTMVNKKSEIIT